MRPRQVANDPDSRLRCELWVQTGGRHADTLFGAVELAAPDIFPKPPACWKETSVLYDFDGAGCDDETDESSSPLERKASERERESEASEKGGIVVGERGIESNHHSSREEGENRGAEGCPPLPSRLREPPGRRASPHGSSARKRGRTR